MTIQFVPPQMPANVDEMPDKYFTLLRNLIHQKSGIWLSDNKKTLLRTRLLKRMRELGVEDFSEYHRYVEADTSNDELRQMLDVISTNVTSFFREQQHFDFLARHVIPQLTAAGADFIHFWSAACSTGEEPYSLAMTIMEAIPNYQCHNIRILATDIAGSVLQTAERGFYRADKVEGIPPQILQKYFHREKQNGTNGYAVNTEVKNMVRFRMLNLNGPSWPFKKKFDVILCRNVMIYFDRKTQQELVSRFAANLKPGGHLLVGHSESLTGIRHEMKFIQATVYKK